MSETGSTAATAHGHHEVSGFWRLYVFSTDHKVIAKQYLGISLFWAVIGAFFSYLMRWQIAYPDNEIPLGAIIGDQAYNYNMLITMHGTIMVFFVAMPLLLGVFGNFLIPLMIGARDMAFPRLNAMSVWTLGLASLILLISFFVPEGAAAGGWTMYAPLSAKAEYSGVEWGMNLLLLALACEFASFLMGGVNFLTTALNMRAPGMSLFRLPIAVWMQLTAVVLFMLSVGPLIAGAVMLLLDRIVGTGFFLPELGGEPLLWQHLFWYFGHPEVYVIMLPGLGFALEVLPVFSRKPLFAYKPIIFATIVAGILSFVVWAHHMFISGLDPRLAFPFSFTTILISIPFALIVFAMIATLWKASISYPTPMLFALGVLLVFLIGGLTGIFNGSAAVDIYIHDTYFVVAHFHYTLISSTFFGGFTAIYFWFPKMFGRMMNEVLGKLHFALTFIFFNLVFFTMFFIGAGGMMRRIGNPTLYEFLKPIQHLNEFTTVCAIILLLSQLLFVVNFFWSLAAGKKAEANPWRATTLEWMTSSPPPQLNFETIPSVHRGPYEYSANGAGEDWEPQNAPPAAVRA